MPDRPDIKPGHWIRVGLRDCVVARVRESGHISVTAKSSLTNRSRLTRMSSGMVTSGNLPHAALIMVDMLISIHAWMNMFAF